MGRRCEEPHCLQLVPDHLFLSHQDEHVAERIVAEEFEQQHQNDPTATDEALARALADQGAETDSLELADEDVDYQMALALNREFRTEDEERSFRNIQKRELGVEDQEEEENRTKLLRLDQSQPRTSTQLILGPNLTPTRSNLRSNQTPGLIHALQRALQTSPLSAYSVLCHPGTSHFASEFSTLGWGCGYHNAQMILSSIRETSPEIYSRAFGDEIPSIGKIQSLIEGGWASGIDKEGAGQLREKLVGTRKWIGTTEIYTFLTSAGFRCLVHDFDFSKPPHTFSLIRYVDDYFQCATPPSSGPSCRISDRPPLYFQHRGHSRTIVGIEHLSSKHINLLLYDPSHKPSAAVKDLAAGIVSKKDLSEIILKPYRVSIDDLAKKREYQILRLQEGMIGAVEVETRKKVNFIKMN